MILSNCIHLWSFKASINVRAELTVERHAIIEIELLILKFLGCIELHSSDKLHY